VCSRGVASDVLTIEWVSVDCICRCRSCVCSAVKVSAFELLAICSRLSGRDCSISAFATSLSFFTSPNRPSSRSSSSINAEYLYCSSICLQDIAPTYSITVYPTQHNYYTDRTYTVYCMCAQYSAYYST
jgi:hypothetical protein